ncbi:MAG: hypothetical protein RR602_08285 [Longicatena sp.]
MSKKILLFLVEGLSDKDALEPILSELVDETKIHFEVIRYDLSANNSTQMKSSNMKQRITKIVKSFLENNHGIEKKSIEKVIFLTDTDGCYVDESTISYSSTDQNFRYEDDGIYTNRPKDAILRNQIKTRNLDTINSTLVVYNRPIEVYYFSCNLDHVLYDKRNLAQSLKEDYAFSFADKYENREDEFIDFISTSSLCLSFNYRDSWMKIKNNNNSLLRYTNLLIFFLNNIDLLSDDAKRKVSICCS